MFESTFVGHGDASGKSWPVVVSFLAQSLLVCDGDPDSPSNHALSSGAAMVQCFARAAPSGAGRAAGGGAETAAGCSHSHR